MTTRFLVFAYACEPGRGSEPGAGWTWSRMIGRLGEAWILTRSNNKAAIERALRDAPESDRLHFVYLDLPAWARFWKRGQRGIRAYYVLWLCVAVLQAHKLRRRLRFDATWHLTMANVWIGTPASLLRGPFIYGPVGGGVRTMWSLLPAIGWRGASRELLRSAVRVTCRYFNPMARLAWRRARVIFVLNAETRDWLPLRYRSKAVVFPNAVLAESPPPRQLAHERPPSALYAGNLNAAKGVALAIRAMRELPGWRLIVCGTGPDDVRLRRLARRLGVADAVDFRGFVERHALFDVMSKDADVFVFPSLHDQSPWVLHEARAAELPVVSLDGAGSGLLTTNAVAVTSVRETARRLARAVEDAHGDRPPPVRADLTSKTTALRAELARWAIVEGDHTS